MYHNKVFPEVAVADNGVAIAPWQYATFVVTTGAEGAGLIVTVIVAGLLSHPNALVCVA